MNVRFSNNARENNIYVDGLLVGRISFRETNDSIFIDSISIDFKFRNKGYGRTIINHLKRKGKRIVGDSAPLAIGFWKTMGALFEFNINETNEMEIHQLLDMGIFPSFSIECSQQNNI